MSNMKSPIANSTERPSPLLRLQRLLTNPHFAAFAILLCGLAVTFLGWRNADRLTERLAVERFNNKAAEIAHAIEDRLDTYEMALRGGLSMLSAVGPVSRDQWREYVGKLNVLRNYPGIQGIGYSLLIKPEDLAAHVQFMRKDGFPTYAIRPPGERDTYTAIIYLEPFDARNQRAFGFDMFSDPIRRAAMERARDSGQTVASARVTLVQETDKGAQAGFLMYLPHYARGVPTFTTEERRAALRGYVYSPFRMNDFMLGIVGHSIAGLGLEVYDGASPKAEALMFRSEAQTHQGATGRQALLQTMRSLKFFGHEWTLSFQSLPEFEAEVDRTVPHMVLSGGISISFLLSFVAFSLLNTRTKALSLAGAMTLELRKSEEHTRLILESTGEPIYGIDTKGECTFCNAASLRALGYASPNDLLGKNMHALIHHSHSDGSRFDVQDCRIYRAFQKGEGTHADDEVLWRADGTSFLAEYWSYPQKRGGQTVGAVVVFQDITERRQAEADLRESEGRLSAVLENAVEAIFTVNQDGLIRSANAAACKIFNYTQQELVRHNVRMLMPEPYHSEHDGYLARYLSTGAPRIIGQGDREVIGKRKDGSVFPVELSVSDMVINGEHLFTGILRDISERVRVREAMEAANEALAKGETFLKSITNNIPGLVGYWNAELYCEFANNAYLNWFGKTPQEMRGIHMPEFLGQELFTKNEKFITAALRGEPQHFERVLTKTDGSQRHTLSHYIPDTDGDVVRGFFVLVNDVTELKSAQFELEERQRHLDADMEAAAEIQRSLLPKEGTCSLGVEADYRFMPSTIIGGDIFNVVCLGEQHTGLYMVDVSGHGVPAALVSVSVAQELSPNGAVLMDKATNQPRSPEIVLGLLDSIFPLERFDKFFSMVYMVYDPDSGLLTYCNAGHPAPLLLRAGGGMEHLEEGGTLVGMGLGSTYAPGQVHITEGDALLIYTDGVTELESPEGEQYGDQRLESAFRDAQEANPEHALQLITSRLQTHADGRPPDDDISLVYVRFSRI